MKFSFTEVDVLTGETRRIEVDDPDAPEDTPVSESIGWMYEREGAEVLVLAFGRSNPNGKRFVSIIVDDDEPTDS